MTQQHKPRLFVFDTALHQMYREQIEALFDQQQEMPAVKTYAVAGFAEDLSGKPTVSNGTINKIKHEDRSDVPYFDSALSFSGNW